MKKQSKTKKVKTPKSLYRWSGGKSRAQKFIEPFMNIEHGDFREMFLGGGSTFLYKDKSSKNWLNDLDPIIYDGFTAIQQDPEGLIELMKEYTPPTTERYHYVKDTEEGDMTWKGFRAIYLNRTSFNGMIKCGPIGGRKPEGKKWQVDACWKNPDNLIQRVRENHEKLKDVKISSVDFEELITEPGDNVLLFVDPPYPEKNNLYNVGMSDEDHLRLRDLLSKTEHNFLLTYNDGEEVREMYKDEDKFIILEKSWTYSMMSQSKSGCRVGEELFIINKDFPIDLTEHLRQDETIDEQIDEVVEEKNNKSHKEEELPELKDYEIRKNMSSDEVLLERYIKKINQEISDDITEQEVIERSLKSEEDIKNGNIKSLDELKKDIKDKDYSPDNSI
ncbi:hypothetical protein COB55_03560 [Candidatus Wolfebacteria bacterium]|nr:MAG: hypothetical protein COB55_03560 [Candidatus Wolfebacteria bacterium]